MKKNRNFEEICIELKIPTCVKYCWADMRHYTHYCLDKWAFYFPVILWGALIDISVGVLHEYSAEDRQYRVYNSSFQNGI